MMTHIAMIGAVITNASGQLMVYLFGFGGSFSRGYRRKFALKATHGGAELVGTFRHHIATPSR